MINKEYLKELCGQNNLALSQDTLALFDEYAALLCEWNQKINLTAITEPDEIVLKHFYDSLLLLKYANVKENASLIDVGTGAGFPGIPLALARKDIKLTLLDSLNKRVNFLNEVCKSLSVCASCVHARAEDGGRDPLLREKFDVATARAVAALRELAEYCLPFVKVGGYFVAMKGANAQEEIAEAKTAIKLLGGEIEEIMEYTLPGGDKRNIIVIKKIARISDKFPRIPAKIKKQPL